MYFIHIALETTSSQNFLFNGSKTIVDLKKEISDLSIANTNLQTQIDNTNKYTFHNLHSGGKNRYLEIS